MSIVLGASGTFTIVTAYHPDYEIPKIQSSAASRNRLELFDQELHFTGWMSTCEYLVKHKTKAFAMSIFVYTYLAQAQHARNQVATRRRPFLIFSGLYRFRCFAKCLPEYFDRSGTNEVVDMILDKVET
jgi:hypothetical protein